MNRTSQLLKKAGYVLGTIAFGTVLYTGIRLTDKDYSQTKQETPRIEQTQLTPAIRQSPSRLESEVESAKQYLLFPDEAPEGYELVPFPRFIQKLDVHQSSGKVDLKKLNLDFPFGSTEIKVIGYGIKNAPVFGIYEETFTNEFRDKKLSLEEQQNKFNEANSKLQDLTNTSQAFLFRFAKGDEKIAKVGAVIGTKEAVFNHSQEMMDLLGKIIDDGYTINGVNPVLKHVNFYKKENPEAVKALYQEDYPFFFE